MEMKSWQLEHKPSQLIPDALTPCSWGKALAFEELRCGRTVGRNDSALGRLPGKFHVLLLKCIMEPNDLSAEVQVDAF